MEQEKITIRQAIPDDLDSLFKFEQGVIDAERPYDPTLDPGEIFYYDLQKLITSPDTELMVAEVQARLVGSGYARIEKAKPYNALTHYSYLGFMYVLPEYRGKGINRMIIDALKEWSRSRNIFEMRLDVYNDNEAAIRAYEKRGFSKHLINMRVDMSDKNNENNPLQDS